MLTLDREEEIRRTLEGLHDPTLSEIKDLLDEVDRLRAELLEYTRDFMINHDNDNGPCDCCA